jgi:ppGpp synthetase/RelA/SpoT-type nucleotidyltranferase
MIHSTNASLGKSEVPFTRANPSRPRLNYCRVAQDRIGSMTEDERIESLISAYRRRSDNYRRLGEDVQRMLQDLLTVAEIPVSSVTFRPKEIDSLRRKLRSSDKYQALTDITDIVGARVITFFADDVDRVANIIRRADNFAIDLANSIDKRRELRPDQFGYQSLHLVATLSKQRIFNENRNLDGLKIEIQVRSLLQHAWAEIEHAYYKSERSLPPTIARRVSLVAGLLEVGDNEFIAIRRDAAEIVRSLPMIRAEGVTELIPDFWLDLPCHFVDTGSAAILSVNANITNRVLADSGTTDVEMHIEDRYSYCPPIKAAMAGVNALKFALPKLLSPAKADYVRFRISGLRVNAFQLGAASTLAPTTVHAMLTGGLLSEAESSEPAGSQAPIAQVVPSMRYSVRNDEPAPLPSQFSRAESTKEILLTIRFDPNFPGAFRTAIHERSATEISDVRGTRLALWLKGAPEGARMFVTVRELPDNNEPPLFQLTKTDVMGVSPFEPVEGTVTRTIGRHEVQVAEIERARTDLIPHLGTHIAVWECISSPPPNKVPSFGLIIALPSQADISTILAHGMYAPLAVVPVASFDAPIPRFGPFGVPVRVLEASMSSGAQR